MPRQSNAEGFAQIIALTGLAILGGMIATLQLQATGATRAQSALQQAIVGRIAAGSATRRVFSAIENDADTLEATLARGNGTLQLHEAGLDMAVSLEREGGKISAANSPSELMQGYLAGLGVVSPASAGVSEVQATAGVRAMVTIGLLQHNVDASFDQEFSRYHLSLGINPLFASDRVLDAVPDLTDWDRGDILRDRHTGKINAISSYFSADVTALSLVLQSPARRSTFVLTAGGKVEVRGSTL